MKKKNLMRDNQSGFSLIEVLLAIVILALVATPILQIFVSSMNISSDSRRLLGATEVGQAAMEVLNSTTVDDDAALRAGLEAAGVTYLLDESYPVVNKGTASSHVSFVNNVLKPTMASQVANMCVADCAASGSVIHYAYHDVDHNGYEYDIVITLTPDAGALANGDEFYTYDVYLEVYASDKGDTGLHYHDLLVKMNGAVFNKR